MDKDTKDQMIDVAEGLRKMRAHAARAENRMHHMVTESLEVTPDEILHHEWLLGRFSGVSEALAYVESFIESEAD